MSNQCVRLVREGHYAFLRYNHPTPPLGVDRAQELRFLQAASACGLTPPLLAATNSWQLIQWHSQPNWQLCPPERSLAIQQLANQLVRLHHIKVNATTLDLAAHLYGYRTRLSPPPSWLLQLERGLTRLPKAQPPLPTHHDLNPSNILGSAALFIDWEYAALGQFGFELATIVRSHGWSVEEGETLLEHYYQRGGTAARPPWRDYLPIVDYLSLLWLLEQEQHTPAARLTPLIESCRRYLE